MSDEDKRYYVMCFGAALVAAVGTKIGEWCVYRIRSWAKDDEVTRSKQVQT
jgi:hypothetical protein